MRINPKYNKMLEKADIEQEIEKKLMNLQRKNKNRKKKIKEIVIDLKDRNHLEKDNIIQFRCLK